jgi:hypothetical protein
MPFATEKTAIWLISASIGHEPFDKSFIVSVELTEPFVDESLTAGFGLALLLVVAVESSFHPQSKAAVGFVLIRYVGPGSGIIELWRVGIFAVSVTAQI